MIALCLDGYGKEITILIELVSLFKEDFWRKFLLFLVIRNRNKRSKII